MDRPLVPTSKRFVFKFIVEHIFKQGVRSASPKSGMCRYRGPMGRKCVVGALIPDNEYDEGFEGGTVMRLLWYYMENTHKVDADGYVHVARTEPHSVSARYVPTLIVTCMRPGMEEMLGDLQRVHDDADSWTTPDMHAALRRVADAHGLDYNDYISLQLG